MQIKWVFYNLMYNNCKVYNTWSIIVVFIVVVIIIIVVFCCVLQKREARVLQRWKKVVRGALIRERVKRAYSLSS